MNIRILINAGRMAGAVLAAVLALNLSACSRGGPVEERAAHLAKAEEVGIGVAWPLSVVSDELFQKGLELAAKEINESGGVLGKPVRLHYMDDEGRVDKGLVAAQAFSENPHIAAVIGHADSFITIPASLIYQYNGLLMITPSATAPQLTEQGFSLVFRTIPSDAEIGAGLAHYCLEQGYTNVAIYYVKNAYGKGLANAFEREADLIGLTIVDRLSYDYAAKRIYKQVVETWREQDFDAMFLASVMPEIGEFITLAREVGLDMPILGGDGLDTVSLLKLPPEISKGVIVASAFDPSSPREEVAAFRKKFSSEYAMDPDAWASQGYDTLRLLAAAMNEAGSINPLEVAPVLKKIHWEGVTGVHQFNAKGDVISKPFVIKRVEDGKFVFIREVVRGDSDELR